MVIPRRSALPTPRKGVAGLHRNRWPASPGMGGRLGVERVAALPWNQWPAWTGIRTRRVRELEERYAEPLPAIEREVEDLAARVSSHLEKMGVRVNV